MNCKHCKEKDEELKKLQETHIYKTNSLKDLLKELKETLKDTTMKQTELLKSVSDRSNNIKLTEAFIRSFEYFSDIYIELCELLYKKLGEDKEVTNLVDKLTLQMYEISEVTTEAYRIHHKIKDS